MRRFNFTLEKVLGLRKHREQETELALGRAMGALEAIENRLAELAVRLSQAVSERFLPEHSLETIQDYDSYIRRLESTRDRLLREAAEAAAKVEEARRIYLEASRDRKVLDKLREIRRDEYRREIFAAETRELDDLSGGRDARKAAGLSEGH